MRKRRKKEAAVKPVRVMWPPEANICPLALVFATVGNPVLVADSDKPDGAGTMTETSSTFGSITGPDRPSGKGLGGGGERISGIRPPIGMCLVSAFSILPTPLGPRKN